MNSFVKAPILMVGSGILHVGLADPAGLLTPARLLRSLPVSMVQPQYPVSRCSRTPSLSYRDLSAPLILNVPPLIRSAYRSKVS
uniref:Uncharacterized protein n=1 Tax=Picea glauca TaxID=3330 RepID=A0A117NH24_PICGL|nr:hypothetical protein ABT39_MTgene5922 [Picea glauca]QHR92040.1 hypothetical protein Q903MT_gene6076 [Picea sitchensis]